MPSFKPNDIVELTDGSGRHATVRFAGTTSFQVGEWVGIELEDLSGKNDGSVKGESYFECEMGRGMFVRPAALTLVKSFVPPASAMGRRTSVASSTTSTAGGAVKRTSRPSSLIQSSAPGRRAGSVSDAVAAKRMSMNAASPTPSASRELGMRPASMSRAPTKSQSPTKQLGSGSSSISSTPRTTTPSLAHKPRPSLTLTGGSRTSMGPPPPRTGRPSLAAGSRLTSSSSVASKTPTTSVNRLSLAQRAGSYNVGQRLGSNTSQASSQQGSVQGSERGEHEYESSMMSEEPDVLSPPILSPPHPGMEQSPQSPTTARSTSSQITARGTAASITANRKQMEDLETKLRLLERHRAEDRERLKELDHIQSERDKFEGIIKKLQTKYQPQQQEIVDLRKELIEARRRVEEVEQGQADHDHMLENATMDQLIAEEQADVMRYELEALRARAEELELEVEVLREENNELGGEMSAEEKAGQGWIAMERNNERLREALLRLRDITQETEEDLKHQIKNLESDLNELSGIKEQYEETKAKLAQSESTIEDLRQQLDNALGAEDMIEELTERNMAMSEQLEEMRATISDLEALKELNDELEINHVETGKELQEDLDFKDTVINEQARRAAEQMDAMEDMEYTLTRFRELVTNLQSDLEDMRASHAVTETEAEKLNSSSRAMMDLNMKLQLSAAKTQVKTIELELRRLEAQEASDHLGIVQLFLPEGYASEKDSVLALLRFKRVGFKANLLHGFVKERITAVQPGHEDDIFAACDVLDKLAWVSAMCARFVSAISSCSTEQFAKFEGALYELEPVERALNAWIDGLRKDELMEKECASDLQRTVALMSHLAEIHIADAPETFGDGVIMRTVVMQSHLESAASALASTRQMVQTAIPAPEGDDREQAEHFAKKIDGIITHTRSAKVIASKAVRASEELKARSLSLPQDTLSQFEACEEATQQLALFVRQVGLDVYTLLSEEGRADPFTYREIESVIHRTTSSVLSAEESDIFSTFANHLRTLTTDIQELATLVTDPEVTSSYTKSPPPWILRSAELTSSRTVPVDAEEEMRRLREDCHERARTIARRDQALEEADVKIELLESRTKDTQRKADRIKHLEEKIDAAKVRERELSDALEAQNREFEALEKEKEKWRRVAGEARPAVDLDPASALGKERAVATAREMSSLKEQISALEAAVRYLREDARRTKLSTMEVGNVEWLHEPLLPAKSQERQEKELLVAEGKDVLGELMALASEAKLFELGTLPRNRLAWRPVRSTPGYHVKRQNEEWETWRGWEGEVVNKAKRLIEPTKSKRGLTIKVQKDITEGGQEAEPRIVGDEDFEGFKGKWGFM